MDYKKEINRLLKQIEDEKALRMIYKIVKAYIRRK